MNQRFQDWLVGIMLGAGLAELVARPWKTWAIAGVFLAYAVACLWRAPRARDEYVPVRARWRQ